MPELLVCLDHFLKFVPFYQLIFVKRATEALAPQIKMRRNSIIAFQEYYESIVSSNSLSGVLDSVRHFLHLSTFLDWILPGLF